MTLAGLDLAQAGGADAGLHGQRVLRQTAMLAPGLDGVGAAHDGAHDFAGYAKAVIGRLDLVVKRFVAKVFEQRGYARRTE